MSKPGVPSSGHSLLGDIPKRSVAIWTAFWVVPLIALYALTYFTSVQISHAWYQTGRLIAVVVMVALAVLGLLIAFDLVGDQKSKPWYMIGLLVALVIFWGLFPPAWFFTEYLLFDRDAILLPVDVLDRIRAAPAASQAELAAASKTANLAATKVYADLASKFWVAVGAALVTAIGLSKRAG
jgi:hypothetical protein